MGEIVIDSEEAAEQDTERTLALLGVTREDILRELDYRHRKKMAAARRRMAAAQRAGGERRILRDGDAGGFVEMMIDPASYHYWGRRLGYQCWEDPQFRREYLRDNAESRVKLIGKTGAVTGAMIRNQAPAPRRGPVGKRGRWAA